MGKLGGMEDTMMSVPFLCPREEASAILSREAIRQAVGLFHEVD